MRIASIRGLYDDSMFAPRVEPTPRSSIAFLAGCDPEQGIAPTWSRRKPPPGMQAVAAPKLKPKRRPCLMPGCERDSGSTGLCKPHSEYSATCKQEGCSRRVKRKSRTGYCLDHAGAVSRGRPLVVTGEVCDMPGCSEPARRNGVCRPHKNYSRHCAHPECGARIKGTSRSGMCAEHLRAGRAA